MEEEKKTITITIKDPETGSEITYEVSEEVALRIHNALKDDDLDKLAARWDSGCRLAV